MVIAAATAEQNRRFRRRAVWGVFIFALALAGALRMIDVLSWPVLDAPLGPPNPDVWLRLTQVRQWLAGSDFFDHAVRNTNAPLGGIATPWTRVMDILLSLVYFLLPRGLGVETRLMLAANWLPLLLCLGAVWLIARTALRQFSHSHILVTAVLLAIFNSWRANYYTPGDADHHGLLSLLWCGVLYLVTAPVPRASQATLAGALLGVMIWISPEGLMLAAPVFALMGIEAVLRPEVARRLVYASLGAAVAATIALFIERPPALLMLEVYDSLSIVHVAMLWMTAMAAAGMAGAFTRISSAKARFAVALLLALAVLGGMYALYPKFFGGPLVDADPYIFTHFLPMISEAQPLWRSSLSEIMGEVAQPLLALALLFAARRSSRPARRRFLLILGTLLLYTGLLTVAQIRWGYYLQPVAIILCAALLSPLAMAARGRIPRQWRPYAWMALVLVFAVLLPPGYALATSGGGLRRATSTPCLESLRLMIQTGALEKQLGPKPLTLVVPENAGGDILFFTPYRIIASNYHREGRGLAALHAITRAGDIAAAERALKARDVDAVLYCADLTVAESWLRRIGEESALPNDFRHLPMEGSPVIILDNDKSSY